MQPQDSTPQGKKILCVEDEQFIGELYSRALRKAGHEVTVVQSGQVGLDEAKKDTYDIILLDLMIPDILGIDVLGKLRTETPNLRAKIIITTNLEQDQTTRQSVEKQADGYIIKAEITPRQLVEFVDQIKV